MSKKKNFFFSPWIFISFFFKTKKIEKKPVKFEDIIILLIFCYSLLGDQKDESEEDLRNALIESLKNISNQVISPTFFP